MVVVVVVLDAPIYGRACRCGHGPRPCTCVQGPKKTPHQLTTNTMSCNCGPPQLTADQPESCTPAGMSTSWPRTAPHVQCPSSQRFGWTGPSAPLGSQRFLNVLQLSSVATKRARGGPRRPPLPPLLPLPLGPVQEDVSEPPVLQCDAPRALHSSSSCSSCFLLFSSSSLRSCIARWRRKV